MSEKTTRPSFLFDLANYSVLMASLLVVLPLILYGFLWFAALGVPNRLDPAGDRYAAAWCATAVFVAFLNSWLAYRNSKTAEPYRLLVMLLASALIAASCPTFWGYW